MTQTAPARRPRPPGDETNAVELHGPLDARLLARLMAVRPGPPRGR